MPTSKEEWVARYRTERPRYERFTGEVRELLKKLLSHEGIKATVETRTKEVDSFAGKISRPGKNYTNPLSEVSDLAGLRIIVDSLTDVERVAQLLRSEFVIDAARSVNKADVLDPDRFGYLSQHFIVSLSSNRRPLVEWSG
jgi:ppGpp synthetase/RelA/SpoT-type nucleotidyltranferase